MRSTDNRYLYLQSCEVNNVVAWISFNNELIKTDEGASYGKCWHLSSHLSPQSRRSISQNEEACLLMTNILREE